MFMRIKRRSLRGVVCAFYVVAGSLLACAHGADITFFGYSDTH